MEYPKIILVRHGQTVWNTEKRFQGWMNSPLTDMGKQQAKENGIKIKRILKGLDNIEFYSSPLERATSSAFIVADEIGYPKNKIIFDDRIKEFSYGILEGKTQGYCEENHREIIVARNANKWYYQIEGGESYELVAKRAKDWLDGLDKNKIIILVAHEMINRALRKIYRNLPIEEALKLRQPNNVVLILENGEEKVLI